MERAEAMLTSCSTDLPPKRSAILNLAMTHLSFHVERVQTRYFPAMSGMDPDGTGAGDGNRTRDLLITNQLLYH